jgi:glycosyltransferase involved in cell wall biosynthesis
MSDRPLRIALAAPVTPGRSGGLASAVSSLVQSLGALNDGAEHYRIIVDGQEQYDWLRPFVGPSQQIVVKPRPRKDRWLRAFRPAIKKLQQALSPPRYWPEVPMSDGFYESLGCDLIHFPTQAFTLCGMRTVYNPIDLQHLHYPEFFDAWTLASRETTYRAGCHFAQALIVNSEWIAADIVKQYRVEPAKIHVIPEAPTAAEAAEPSADDLVRLRAKYGLEPGFVFYPAVTWPHKNHVRLLEALAALRDRSGVRLPLVCTGSRFEPFWPQIAERMQQLSLESQVKFLGFVSAQDLRGLYRLASCLVLPSLFEANSLPIFEAWREGTPVVCSHDTALPEQLGDAGLLIDPRDAHAIAEALSVVTTNARVADALRAKGRRRLESFTWERTARAYRDVYRGVAGRAQTDNNRRPSIDAALEARA